MVDHHDHVYLVDFGLTRGLGPTGSGTQAGVAVGTPWYMSPEQAEGQPLDHRSDIYSLGVTLYELATQGLGPFTANREDKRSVIEQVRAGQTLPLRTLAPGIPPELERIILKAMQLKPYKRYECAAEMAHDLEAFVGIVSKKNSRPPAPTESAPGRTRWLWLGGGIAVAVLGVILGSIALWTALATAPVRDRKDDGGIEERNRGRLDGTNAMPVELRGQQLGLHFPLFKENKEPLWKEKLFGRVGYIPYPTNFTLVNNNKSLGILGIADPDRHSFEFSVDVGRIGSTQQENDMSVGRCGIVFGWRRHLAEADSHHRFFNLEFDQQPDWAGGFGNLMIGTGWLVPPAPNRGIGGEFFKRLPGERSILPLRQFRGFHRVHLKVRKDGFAVSVGDGGLVYNITLDTIREFEPLAAPHLDPRGTIGLWVMNGNAEFRNPTLLLRADP
ncbi:MAG: protein kinase [Deltaproteobacteria bacterium]|nr:protein kinase [Deltaproteobacteria bacterium]